MVQMNVPVFFVHTIPVRQRADMDCELALRQRPDEIRQPPISKHRRTGLERIQPYVNGIAVVMA